MKVLLNFLTHETSSGMHNRYFPLSLVLVSAVYQLSGREIVKVKGSGGVSPPDVDLSVRRAEAIYAQGWYDSITHDMFG